MDIPHSMTKGGGKEEPKETRAFDIGHLTYDMEKEERGPVRGEEEEEGRRRRGGDQPVAQRFQMV